MSSELTEINTKKSKVSSDLLSNIFSSIKVSDLISGGLFLFILWVYNTFNSHLLSINNLVKELSVVNFNINKKLNIIDMVFKSHVINYNSKISDYETIIEKLNKKIELMEERICLLEKMIDCDNKKSEI
jgi:hypothetical protein